VALAVGIVGSNIVKAMREEAKDTRDSLEGIRSAVEEVKDELQAIHRTVDRASSPRWDDRPN
jgi:hypothetical protein